MTKPQKWWKPALAFVFLVIATQAGVSLLARTHRVHAYLVAHLERAFGRQMEVESFGARILPSPQLDAKGVTVGEDSSFGHEYFLRAERLSAGVRWTGLLRGHFEFGTMSLSKPSLILVRNSEGRWNLERWLPPPKTTAVQSARVYGPQWFLAAAATFPRSEEHTSELQSHLNLVCRLLLEKKKASHRPHRKLSMILAQLR